ncbi:threonine ammonia-lyase IlvA [Marivirga atlantica]|jgi:threonine dehydratase|uniref:L-threonine dehydratase n=1 Tax=Marivirga atlantica TaxID=1548457 RepID=A0A937AKP1_9BACT|nr:threonine ammonia-lyase IlvA [Marivirga atlantica]MBL0764472.1 threonine ammonia-lyase IlvA [Marivirga atlantica]
MPTDSATYFKPTLDNVKAAAKKLEGVSTLTPLTKNLRLSKHYQANISFKREDLQLVRSYKIRGAYNKISSLTEDDFTKGIVCASAGNHAQGVAYSCQLLKVKGTIFMPAPTPKQKVEQVAMFGDEFVDIILVGDTFDDSYNEALHFCEEKGGIFIHPFDDEKVIEGQATVGLEILNQTIKPIDYLFLPVGGGGLSAGVSSVFKLLSPQTKIIGVEPEGAPAMKNSIEKGKNTQLSHIEKFVDGAAVKKVGDLNFEICRNNLEEVVTVAEGKVCEIILEMYNKDAIVVEPAGALSIAVLEQYTEAISGKNIVCIISGSNNDITRTEEIKERALLHKGLKHYFIVNFPQRAGALKQFVVEVLGATDDITHFEYTKKNSREKGSAVVGIELKHKDDYKPLLQRMKFLGFYGDYINNNHELLDILT